MTTGKTVALTKWTFVNKVMSLLLNMLSRLVITIYHYPINGFPLANDPAENVIQYNLNHFLNEFKKFKNQ